MILPQKIDVPAISRSGFRIIHLKSFKKICRELTGFRPFVDREVPGMLAFFASIDQPHVYAVSVGVHSEFSRIQELLFFPAAAAAMINMDRAVINSGRTPARSVLAHTFLLNISREPSELMLL